MESNRYADYNYRQKASAQNYMSVEPDILGKASKEDMLKRYKVSYTPDQLRYTPPRALDSRITLRVAKDLLTRNADEICHDGKLRYGHSQVIISEQGLIAIEGENADDARRILSLLEGQVQISPI